MVIRLHLLPGYAPISFREKQVRATFYFLDQHHTCHVEFVTPEGPHVSVLGAAAAHDPPHLVPLLDVPDLLHQGLQVQHRVVIRLPNHHGGPAGQEAPDIAWC